MRPLESTILDALEGYVPRHVIDVDVSVTLLESGYEPPARTLIDGAFAAAEGVCETLEAQCHELAALEDDGLAGRIRYFTGVAIAAAVLKGQRGRENAERLAYLQTVHAIAESRRAGTTYDLSNASASLLFWRGRHGPARALGTWIWMNLLPTDASVHVRWVASTLRFANAFGVKALTSAENMLLDIGRTHAAARESSEGNAVGVQVAYTREEARRIAEAYVADHGGAGNGIVKRDVYSVEEIPFRTPTLYGVRLEGCWITYLRQPGVRLRSSQIVVVSKATGAVLYAGSAQDEG